MIRVFVRTDETMPEHEIIIISQDATMAEALGAIDNCFLGDKDDLIEIKSGLECDQLFIRASAIKFIRVTEERENE